MYQHYEKKLLTWKKEPEFHIFLWGGCSEGVNIKCNDINEFNFSDSWSAERYQMVCIYNNRWQRLTKKRINDLMTQIQDDFELDGTRIEIKSESGNNSDKGICFNLIVKE